MTVRRIIKQFLRAGLSIAFLICLIAVQAGAHEPAQCRAPDYREGAVWERSQSAVFMAISIPLKDFAPSRLECVAQALRDRYHDQKKIKILIFSSRDAAKQYNPYPGADYRPLKNGKQQKLPSLSFWLSQLHGSYVYDSEKRDEHLDIRPFGSDFDGGPDDTRISLPAAQIPTCKLGINGRCLLTLGDIIYPNEALKESISDNVTLTGSIRRNGRLTQIKVAGVQVQPPQKAAMLVNEAVRNLKSWRFEPTSRTDPLRITYSYVLDPALLIPPGYHRFASVQFELPNQVIIRGHSLD
jgi:hypothetical protein